MFSKVSPLHSLATTGWFIVRWIFLILPLSIITGSLVALFLWLLESVTQLRWLHAWLLYCLPIAGIGIYVLYRLFGKDAEAGNNLIIDEIHQPGGGVPPVMTPLVLATTIITHLFGGSAGREGTAVQMGGSMASLLAKWYALNASDTRLLLIAGVAGGFGAVFGTPVTGAVFALEVVAIGSLRYEALIPALAAAIASHFVCLAWGIHHTAYAIQIPESSSAGNLFLLIKIIIAAVFFGLISRGFAGSIHQLKKICQQWVRPAWIIPVIGGGLIISLTWISGSRDFLGLGVTNPNPGGSSIVAAFHAHGVGSFDFAWKLLFTVVTLSSGFKGGEVTPLFFIGAALGCSFASWLQVPADLMAGLGLIAVFAGATNTPIACTLMGVELFGGHYVLYYAVACFMAYYFSGHTGIYGAQRVFQQKIPAKSL